MEATASVALVLARCPIKVSITFLDFSTEVLCEKLKWPCPLKDEIQGLTHTYSWSYEVPSAFVFTKEALAK